MIIKKASVVGLFGGTNQINYDFHEDLNIITGRNGSGKTTLLKLVWFIISGNILHALREVNFRACSVTTDLYSCTVVRTGPAHCRVTFERGDESHVFEDDEGDPSDMPFFESAEDKVKPYLQEAGSSIFFPTFRRIEGGFTIPADASRNNRVLAGSDVDDVLSTVSRKLSAIEHVFVAAISTYDIKTLLIRRYNKLSEEVAVYQEEVTKSVIEKIRHYQSTESSKATAEALLDETRTEIEKIEEYREATMLPLDAVRFQTEKLFKHSGIYFGKRLSFGDAAAAVNSDKLSAGEKQMLSFVCYNAFYKNSVIFIDEPELSLHVDWQRQLYPILRSQKSSNQFIFATHSPFIYAKYPDKELTIGSDRGGEWRGE